MGGHAQGGSSLHPPGCAKLTFLSGEMQNTHWFTQTNQRGRYWQLQTEDNKLKREITDCSYSTDVMAVANRALMEENMDLFTASLYYYMSSSILLLYYTYTYFTICRPVYCFCIIPIPILYIIRLLVSAGGGGGGRNMMTKTRIIQQRGLKTPYRRHTFNKTHNKDLDRLW